MGARAWRRKNGSLLLVQCPSIVHGPRVTGSARRARASDAHVLGLVYRERERSGAQARYTRKPPSAVRGRPARGRTGWRRRNASLAIVQCRSKMYGPIVPGLAQRARASEAHTLGLVPRESERSAAQARYTRKPPRAVRGRPGTWEHGPGAERTAVSRSCSALP